MNNLRTSILCTLFALAFTPALAADTPIEPRSRPARPTRLA